MTKLKNLKWNKTLKKNYDNPTTQIVKKLTKLNFYKTQKIQIVTKLKNSNCGSNISYSSDSSSSDSSSSDSSISDVF